MNFYSIHKIQNIYNIYIYIIYIYIYNIYIYIYTYVYIYIHIYKIFCFDRFHKHLTGGGTFQDPAKAGRTTLGSPILYLLLENHERF